MKTRIILTALAALTAYGAWSPEQAHARKKGVLEGEPIVRKKLQLRRFRFQLAPFVGMSLSQPFVHMGYVGARIGVHFADWIGVRAGFGYGVINLDSKLLKAINGGGVPTGIAPGQPDTTSSGMTICPVDGAPCRSAADADNPAPLKHDFQAGLTRAQWQSSVDVVFTPFSGKLGLFSAIFTEYDIYVFGGLGLVGFQKHYEDARSTADRFDLATSGDNLCQDDSGAQNDECLLHPVKADTGVKVGGSFGAGLNLFLTDWVSLGFEIQDIVTRNNVAGLNSTVTDIPPRVDRDDRDAFHNVTFQLGATFYFPPKAKRTK
ncbi:MAG: outer membrane beta-barrel domain-containing protein [Deltaproteobacteria bacterium]|nr:outer membrane beta-barrel domain-containing protein [Nannocystaceae bacterium]